MRYLHEFDTVAEYTTARNDNYLEPWVSYTEENTKVNYNKSEYETPLTFEITGNGNIVWKASSTAYTVTIEYSKDNGSTWTSITSTTGGTPIQVVSGDTLQFRGNNTAYGTSSSYNIFIGSTAQFKVKGNIMSLINSTNFGTLTTLENAYTFYGLFIYCTGLTDASELLLPATTLADYCYDGMFARCTSLTTAPSLPATTLADYCYGDMFYGCTSLTTAPSLPATTLADYCYDGMFDGCTSLTTAPSLPATTLANSCYRGMFRGCTNLTTAPELPATILGDYCYQSMFDGCRSLTTAPSLPATVLANYCYDGMFINCTSLTIAPSILPATTLTPYCYRSMFEGCTSLNYIKCLATDISANNCTYNWVTGVASSGTFIKNPSMASWTTGDNGVPSGWTVEDA